MNESVRSRNDFEAEFRGEKCIFTREREGIYDKERDKDIVYEKVGIFNEEGPIAVLEYIEDSLDDFENLVQREANDPGVDYDSLDSDLELSEFKEIYNSLNPSNQSKLFASEEVKNLEASQEMDDSDLHSTFSEI